MNKDTLYKANVLSDDISEINYILDAKKRKTPIKVVTRDTSDFKYSNRFQDELEKWLKTKLTEYEKELEEL